MRISRKKNTERDLIMIITMLCDYIKSYCDECRRNTAAGNFVFIHEHLLQPKDLLSTLISAHTVR